MDWRERIRQYTTKKRKYDRARERFNEVKGEWSDEQDALLGDLTAYKEQAGEDPTCVVNGRMIGKTYAVGKSCTDPTTLTKYLVDLGATEFLKPRVEAVFDAWKAGQFDDEASETLRKLLTETKIPKLFDKKAPGVKR